MLGIVTATTNPERAAPSIQSWLAHASSRPALVVVENGTHGQDSYVGTVPAFRRGVDELLLNGDVHVIACLHDDVTIYQDGWDDAVLTCFRRHPEVGLVGFGGAIGLGSEALYREPYDPMQLARIGYRSNVVDAEAHGTRSLLPERVVCLDGFSQIGRRAFWQGQHFATIESVINPPDGMDPDYQKGLSRENPRLRPWTVLEESGFIHHFYDGALGCLACRMGWYVYYLPVRCRHLGGQTAVGDPGYQRWAASQINGGDRGFWEQAHRRGYDLFKDVLPLRVTARERDANGPAA